MSIKPIDVGFVEEKSTWLLHPRFFPSKVGGKPAWLDLKNVPNLSEIICSICNNPLIFLCQVYAPFEEKDDCFHRTLFIFICKNGSCCKPNSANNIKVFRCQLPRKNDFYSFEPYEEKETEIFNMEKWPKHCILCGLKAPSHCSKCKKVYYCSRQHQILDWQKGHKQLCANVQQGKEHVSSNFIVTETGKSVLFKEWELIVDEEDEDDNTTDVNVDTEMDKLKKMIEDKKAGTMNDLSDTELEQYAKPVSEDKVFNKFSKRIARHPDQVLRYDKGGVPLWITSDTTTNSIGHIPNCQYCDGERQFEFQIMPQLLNFINAGIELNSIDWGVIVVYTCKNSCNVEPAYKEEFVIKQDLSN